MNRQHRVDSGSVYVDTSVSVRREYRVYVSADFGGSYRISVPTEIRAGLGLQYRLDKLRDNLAVRKHDYFVVSVSAGITHYIF